MRRDIDEKRNEIEQKLRSGHSRAEISRWLGCKEATLKLRLDKWELHDLKNQGGRGRKSDSKYRPAEFYLKLHGPRITSDKLKKKLWRDGFKEKRCEHCGIAEWCGEEAPLELDHINGDHYDNRLENLRILCPNCHALTPTNSGKNIKAL